MIFRSLVITNPLLIYVIDFYCIIQYNILEGGVEVTAGFESSFSLYLLFLQPQAKNTHA